MTVRDGERVNDDAFERKLKAAEAALAAAAERTYTRKQSGASKSALIVALRPRIEALKAKGATWGEIAEILAPTVGATKATIRVALASAARPRKRMKSAALAQRKPAKQVAMSGRVKPVEEPQAMAPTARPPAMEHAASRNAGRKP